MKQDDTPRGKTGPKPKQLTETTILGIPVGRGDNKAIVPPDQVYELASIGCSDSEICGFFGIKPDSLRRNFASELTKGREYVKIRLRKAMLKNACDHMAPSVQIFLAKNLLGMSDSPIDAEANTPLPWNEQSPDEEIDYENERQDENIE